MANANETMAFSWQIKENHGIYMVLATKTWQLKKNYKINTMLKFGGFLKKARKL